MARPIIRISGGAYAGRQVRGGPAGTRSATARLRTSIFDRPDVRALADGRVLDLYAGAGLLGLEALSHGAAWVDFVERSRPACDVIRSNLAGLGAGERARVHCGTVERARARLTPPYDLCFADPPYLVDALPTLGALLSGGLLAGDGLLLWRHLRRQPGPECLGPLARCDVRRYGDGVLESYRAGGAP